MTPEFATQAIAELEVAKREAGNGELVGSVSVESAAAATVAVPRHRIEGWLNTLALANEVNRHQLYDEMKGWLSAPSSEAVAPDGWKLVPVELTEPMRIAGYLHKDKLGAKALYRALIAAAPEAPSAAPAAPVASDDADLLATIDKLVRIGGKRFPCFDEDEFLDAVRARFARSAKEEKKDETPPTRTPLGGYGPY